MWTITTSPAASWHCMLESSADVLRRRGGGMKFLSWVLVVMLAFASAQADAARRLGGGGSVGKQSGNVTQRSTAPTLGMAHPSAGRHIHAERRVFSLVDWARAPALLAGSAETGNSQPIIGGDFRLRERASRSETRPRGAHLGDPFSGTEKACVTESVT